MWNSDYTSGTYTKIQMINAVQLLEQKDRMSHRRAGQWNTVPVRQARNRQPWQPPTVFACESFKTAETEKQVENNAQMLLSWHQVTSCSNLFLARCFAPLHICTPLLCSHWWTSQPMNHERTTRSGVTQYFCYVDISSSLQFEIPHRRQWITFLCYAIIVCPRINNVLF